MLAEEFPLVLSQEHRAICAALEGLIEALERIDHEEVRSSLALVGERAGPHFRYEEEALFPALAGLFGEAYLEWLLREREATIGAVRKLKAIAAFKRINVDDSRHALELARRIMAHIRECETLEMPLAALPREKIDDVMQARDRSLHEALGLLEWADGPRPFASRLRSGL
jgi:Hemerythrin HHE cation binding domain